MIEWFARNSVAANLLMITIIMAGMMSLIYEIPVQTFPETDPDTITVTVPLRGATPEDMELGVAIRIEEAVADLIGVDKITSVSREGSTSVNIRVDEDSDPRELLDDIKNRVDSINTFPAEAEKPIIALLERRSAVIQVLISGDYNEIEIRRYSEKVRDDLLQRPDITSAELAFGRNYEIGIEVSQDQLRKYQLSLAEVANAVRGSSLDLSAGNVRTQGGDVLIRSKGQAYTKSDFETIVVKTHVDGSIIQVGDIANVIDGFEEDSINASFNGSYSGMIQVYRTGDQGAIEVADSVKQYIENQQELLPVGMELSYWDDDSDYLKQRLGTLITNMISGGVLVILLLALFLRPAVAFWVFIGIPISFIGSFIVLMLTNTPIDVMSLFGYILVLGIVVDDAIVTGESIYTKMEGANSGLDAAITGAKNVAIPVTFGVITTMAAFVPMFYLDGMFARFMTPIPGVVIAVLLFSLIESKFVLPAHLKNLQIKPRDKSSAFSQWQQNFARGFERLIIKGYRPALEICVRNRYAVLTGFICCFGIIIAMLLSGHSVFQTFPRVPADTVRFTVSMPVGTPFNVTDSHIQNITAEAEKLQQKYLSADGQSALKNILSLSGTAGQAGTDSAKGMVLIETDPDRMTEVGMSTQRLAQEWRLAVGDVVGAESTTIRAEVFRVGDPIDVQLSGQSFEALSAAAEEVKQHLRTYDSVYDIADSASDGKQELRVELTQQGHVMGLTRADIISQISQAFRGFEAQRIQRGRDDIRVIIRLPKEERSSTATLDEILIKTARGQDIPLAQIAVITANKGPSEIKRVNRFRVVNITADYDKERTNAVALNNDLAEFMDNMIVKYPGVSYYLTGEAEEQADAFSSMGLAMIGLLFAIYCLLALPLKSYGQPLIIMSVIPFSMIGAIIGHSIMGETVSILSMMGVLALTGVVVNDSLVLVDYTNQQTAKGRSLVDSILNAGTARFRAVMLTSLTTFFGLLPMMFASSVQASFLVPMAISLGFGIIFGSMITLILVPSNLLIARDIKQFFSSGSKI